jgi:hypothetical protein
MTKDKTYYITLLIAVSFIDYSACSFSLKIQDLPVVMLNAFGFNVVEPLYSSPSDIDE